MKKKLQYIIHLHDAHRAGKHFDFRIKYPDNKGLASYAIPKAKFPEYGEKLLAVKAPDHENKWLRIQNLKIPDNLYGAGTIKTIQKGEADILGWGDDLITFKLTGPVINGKYTLIKDKNSDRNWILIKSKDE